MEIDDDLLPKLESTFCIHNVAVHKETESKWIQFKFAAFMMRLRIRINIFDTEFYYLRVWFVKYMCIHSYRRNEMVRLTCDDSRIEQLNTNTSVNRDGRYF